MKSNFLSKHILSQKKGKLIKIDNHLDQVKNVFERLLQ